MFENTNGYFCVGASICLGEGDDIIKTIQQISVQHSNHLNSQLLEKWVGFALKTC